MATIKKKYEEQVREKLKEKYKYSNVMEVPRVLKVVINRGLSESLTNPKVIETTVEQFKAITGQVPVLRKAKKSISNFKLRENQIIGCKVTLRSKRMYDFLTKLVCVGIPKIRDFRGLPAKGFDGRGNYTLGIKEDIIFPEVSLEKVDKLRGMDITVVTSGKTDQEAYDLLNWLGFPFRTALTGASK